MSDFIWVEKYRPKKIEEYSTTRYQGYLFAVSKERRDT